MHVCVLTTLYIILVFLFIMRNLRKAACPPLNLKFFLKSTRPSLLLKKGLSKTHQSSLTLKGGSTAFPKPLSPQGTGDVPTALLVLTFRKPTRPSLPLRKAPPLISVFSPQGKRGNRPTRCSNRYAIRLADHQRSTPAAELRFFVRG